MTSKNGRTPPRAEDVADEAQADRHMAADKQQYHERAELTLLSALFLRRIALPEEIGPYIFYRDMHRVLAERIGDMRDHEIPVDEVTLEDELIRHGQLEAAGGGPYLYTLRDIFPTEELARIALSIVQRCYYERQSVDAKEKMILAYVQGDKASGDKLRADLDYWEDLAAGAEEAARPAPIKFMSLEEAEEMTPARGIIGDILHEDSVAELYAPSGTWKSFLATSWGLHIASGSDWFGRKVIAGHVVYIAAEGARGVGKRAKAWRKHHGIERPSRFHLVTLPVKLTDPAAIEALILSIKIQCGEAPVLVVFDTLARSVDGTTNDDAIMNIVLDSASAIRSEFACCVLVVHHTGKDTSRGSRGSNAMPNGADTVIRIKSKLDDNPNCEQGLEPGDVATVHSQKAKEEQHFADVQFTTEVVTVGVQDDGTPITSLVPIPTTSVAPAKSPQRLPQSSLTALVALSGSSDGLRSTEWMHASGLKKSTFMQWARPDLVGRGFVVESNGTYHIAELGTAHLSGSKSGRIVPFK